MATVSATVLASVHATQITLVKAAKSSALQRRAPMATAQFTLVSARVRLGTTVSTVTSTVHSTIAVAVVTPTVNVSAPTTTTDRNATYFARHSIAFREHVIRTTARAFVPQISLVLDAALAA